MDKVGFLFDEVKRLPLPEVCLTQLGYTPNKAHDSLIWRSLVSPKGDKIIARSIPNENGHYLFKSVDCDFGGSLIDLLLKLHNYTLKQILYEFGTPNFTSLRERTYPPHLVLADKRMDIDNTAAVKRICKEFFGQRISVSNNYFTRRGVPEQVIKSYGLKATYHSTIFPLYSLVNNQWRLQTAIKYFMSDSGERTRLFLNGFLRKGSFSLLKPVGSKICDFGSVVFCESPIDALAFASLHSSLPLAISFCGKMTKDFSDHCLSLLRALRIKEVVLAFDNDEAGVAIGKKLCALLGSTFSVYIAYPPAKDWQEVLDFFTSSQSY